MEFDLDLTLTQMRQLDTTGNIIPHSWYKAITFENGKPDLLGMMILAEIVYWYRPTEIRDQYTGKLIEYRKKFKGDMLQRNYNSFATQFGVSVRQAMDAVKRLEQNGFLIKEVRDVQIRTATLGNVLFIAPNIETLLRLQMQTTKVNSKGPNGSDDEEGEPSAGDPPYTFERRSSYDETYKLMQSNVEAPTFKRSTYTENTTEISPEITHEIKKTAAKEGHEKNAAAAFLKNRVSENRNTSVPDMGIDFRRKSGLMPIENGFSQLLIRESLTPFQKDQVQKVAQVLAGTVSHYDAGQLEEEITFSLLSPDSFTQAGNDFFKKLNTICKTIREGRWQRPVKLLQDLDKEIKSNEQLAILKKRELSQECMHWQMMAKLFKEKNKPEEVEKVLLEYSKAQEALNRIQEGSLN